MAEVTALRNNATPFPIYGAPFGIVFPMLDADGDLVTGATTPDAEVSKNGDTFADCTNESVEIATASGMYYLLLTATEMTADVVTVIAKSATAGMKTTPFVLYPRKLVTVRSGTSASAGSITSTIILDASASAVDDFYNGMVVIATIDSNVEARVISDYVGSTKTASVVPDWNVAPDNTDTFVIKLPEGAQVVQTSNGVNLIGSLGVSQGPHYIDDTLTFAVTTNDPSTGEAVAADADPSYAIYETETATAILGGTLSGLDIANTNNLYSETVTLSAANGFEAGKTYTLWVEASVDAIEGTTSGGFRMSGVHPANVTQFGGSAGTFSGGRPEVNTSHISGTLQTANDVGADVNDILTDTAEIGAAGAGLTNINLPNQTMDIIGNITGNLSGSVGSVTGAVGSVTAGVTLANDAITAAKFDETTAWPLTAADTGATAVARTGADGDTLETLSDQIDDVPTNAELATSQAAADDATLAAIAALNNLSAAQVNTEVDTALADIHLDHLLAVTYDPASKPGAADALLNELVESDAGVARYTANALEQGPGGGSAPTAADIADAVWEEAIADHSGTVGSTAEALGAAGSAGDPWVTALPGAYGAGTAGKIIGDNVNATISSRATQTSVDTVDTVVDTILVDTNELQTDWVNGGRLDNILDARASQTSVDDIPTNAELATSQAAADDATLAAIAALNNLSAAQVNTEVDTAIADAALATAANLATVDTVVDAIKLKTDNLPTDPADQSAVEAAIDSAEAAILAAIPSTAAIEAAILDDASGIETSITPRQAIRLILAASAGKLSGAATSTVIIRNVGDSKDRITATVDADGNRSAVTVDAT